MKNKKIICILAVVILAISVLCVSLLLISKKQNSNNTTNKETTKAPISEKQDFTESDTTKLMSDNKEVNVSDTVKPETTQVNEIEQEVIEFPADINNGKRDPICICRNELNFENNQNVPIVKIQKEENGYIINGAKYTLRETVYSPWDGDQVYWRIDLSALSMCGKSNDIKFYSGTGKCDNDVIIAEQNSMFFLLVKNDILNAKQYQIDDFNIMNEDFNILDPTVNYEYYEQIWNDHLTGEYDLNYMLSEDPYEFIWLQHKEHPELLYPLSFCEYYGDFHTYLPAT